MDPVTTKCVNGDLRVGDLVISTPDDEYSCLIGRVTRINLLGTPEHDEETENETDDVHVCFMEYEYSVKRIAEIEEDFSDLYGEPKEFEECPIDDAIMAPRCLIRITGIDEDRLSRLLESGYNAACYCYGVLSSLYCQTETEILPDSDIKAHIFDVIDSSLALAGYKIMDGDCGCVCVRHCASDTDYEIKVSELA